VSTTLKRVHGYLAEFDNPQDLYHAAEKVRDQGYQRWDVHSPFPIHGMDHAMGNPRSKLPWFVFFGGATGLTVAFLMQFLTQVIIYPTVVQAKPTDIYTLPAFFPVMFELTILFSAFTTLFGLLALIGLPRLNHPLFTSKQFGKFSDDGFFVCIEARDAKFTREGTKSFLEGLGGKNIELIEDEI
jgi:hypothetical protein